jgi:Uma2 family endonuclease
MATIAQPDAGFTVQEFTPPDQGQRVILNGVSWSDYLDMGDLLRDRPALRLTYDRGRLEIITTSSTHERLKKWLGRFVETIAEECGVAILPGGSITFQREDLERGFEPDECYWIANEGQMRGRPDYDPTRDPPPDLVVEIEVTRSALNRMALFARLGVPEVWRFDGTALHVHRLQSPGSYAEMNNSLTFPVIRIVGITRFLALDVSQDYLSTVREFRDWVRVQIPRG